MTSRILVVCTGNVCRSPLAERLLAATLDPSVEVTSRGTHAWTDQDFSPEMAALLKRRRGIVAGARVAVRLTAADVRGADLVLGMEREHRAAAVRMHPAAVQRAFTLAEFARLLTEIDTKLPSRADLDHRVELLVGRAHRGRRPVPAALDDIVDPIGQPPRVYEEVFDQIDVAVARIAAVIGPRG